ncbi:tetratricopeptide repeat protein [Clostridium tyrobutyricum]|uniref:tetratricopeptide repeat protein n=1 Tax=Clostridium tyrobutyricum TaxID=1519 RepID=UPI001C38B695|nr:tetratricopeptide repeat protein [Clostridium tyrobutyricum]MBV4424558.1 hypothetical protein [Clostridium tyrobutyricum]
MSKAKFKKKIFIIISLFIALIAIGFGINRYNEVQSYNELINAGNKYMDSGKYDEAIALYKQCLNYKQDSNVKDSINFAKSLKQNKIKNSNSSSNNKQNDNSNTNNKSDSKYASNINENNSENQISYIFYKNDRYGFCIEYPNMLKTKLKSPANGDGISLETSDSNAKFTVYGSNNVSNDTSTSIYNDLLKEHPNASYKKKVDNEVVFSWINGDKIVYKDIVVGEGSKNAFTIEYPKDKKDYYNSIVSHLYSSFKTPDVAQSH